jgi:hypothetical protein
MAVDEQATYSAVVTGGAGESVPGLASVGLGEERFPYTPATTRYQNVG